MPGAPRQTWYCSVSLRWKRRRGGGACDERRPHVRRVSRRLAVRALERALRRARRAASCSMLPAAATTMFGGDVDRVVVARDRIARDRRDHLGGADHRPAERVVAEDRLRRSGRARDPAACPRTSRSPRARPRARRRARRRAARRPCRPSRRAPSRGGGRGRARRRACARARSRRSARRRARRRSRRSRARCSGSMPLKSRCSMKCETPASASSSSREPAPIQ